MYYSINFLVSNNQALDTLAEMENSFRKLSAFAPLRTLYQAPLLREVKEITYTNNTPLNRGTATIPLLCLSHEKVTTHFTPFEVVVC